jgi:hypothetical protein
MRAEPGRPRRRQSSPAPTGLMPPACCFSRTARCWSPARITPPGNTEPSAALLPNSSQRSKQSDRKLIPVYLRCIGGGRFGMHHFPFSPTQAPKNPACCLYPLLAPQDRKLAGSLPVAYQWLTSGLAVACRPHVDRVTLCNHPASTPPSPSRPLAQSHVPSPYVYFPPCRPPIMLRRGAFRLCVWGQRVLKLRG